MFVELILCVGRINFIIAVNYQPRPQGLLGIFQNGGHSTEVTRHFEKYPEVPGNEIGQLFVFV